MMKTNRFEEKKNKLLKKMFLPYFFILGLLFTGESMLASEKMSPSEEYIQGQSFSFTQESTVPLSLQGLNYNNGNRSLLKLDGIGDDDNGLGEVPSGDGLLLLIGFCVAFIIFRLMKRLFVLKFLQNKRVQFILLLLSIIPLHSFAANYYWVGGLGNWSDISHWATTSGGTTKYTLPPTAADNVFFDAGSGFTLSSKTVTLDQNSFCNNMTWQGFSVAPSFLGSRNVEINGSLLASPGMTFGTSNNLIFKGSLMTNTITTNGVALPTLTFLGTGAWTLMDNLNCASNSITFTSGTLDLNGKNLTCYNFSSSSTNARTLRIAGSTINISSGWTYTGTGSNVLTNAETGNSFIKITGSSGNLLSSKVGDRYNNVEFSTVNGASITNGIYNKVLYSAGSGSISAITTDSLILKANSSFKFSNPSTVNKYFSATPDGPCGGIIDITGGTVNMASGATTNVKNARIKTTTITGTGAPYPAVNSIDAGSNVGWNIQAMGAGNTYYWVAGNGNWTDVNHWANTSGGVGGSGCVPTPFDNVIFDNNSGFTSSLRTVTLDQSAYCDSMSWLGTSVAPILNYSSSIYALEVYGSLYLQRGMQFNPYYLYMYSNRPNEKITSNGNMIYTYVYFKTQNGTGGWSFQDSTRISGGINFYSGNLNFNGQYASVTAFNSVGNAGDYSLTRVLNIANSQVLAYSWDYTGGTTLASTQSDNSIIKLSNGAFSTKATDKYHYLEISNNTMLTSGIYDKITYMSNVSGGTFAGTITADSVIIQNVGNYIFSSTSFVINKYFATKLSCGGVTSLSSNSTLERTITMGNSSELHVSNAQISYVSITGPGVPYPAVNSTKVAGACAGWNFGAVSSSTFYWVGGTGNWNDPAHWSLTSGLQDGSGCIPSPFDEVIFDNNSFSGASQTVTVDGNAYCDSMSWIGNATLKPVFSIKYPVQIGGSVIYQRGMTMQNAGTGSITMVSSRPNEKITSNGVKIVPNLNLNGTGGWIIADSLECTSSFSFINGNLDFNGQYAKMIGFNSASTTNPTRTLNMANAIIDISSSPGWNYQGGVPLTADKSANSTIRISYTSGGSIQAKVGDVYNNVEFPNGAVIYSASISRGTYNKITFSKLSAALNTIVVDTLIFAPGGSINTFASSTTSVVNKLWLTNGTPCLPTTIQSLSTGIRTNISMPATAANILPDTVMFEFVRIRDLNAVAGADRAKLKKGPQSIDDSGYGLSGNNNNWTIVPYAGANGFKGLGADVSRGCQDYPFQIELASTYLAGPDGSYEWRKDNPSGPIIGTQPQLAITSAGTYYLKVNYDLGKTCVLSDFKNVFSNADTLIWTGSTGTSDWNNFANWKKPNGTSDMTTVPRACTDVLIPTGVSVYPNLSLVNTSRSTYNNAACRNIHFGAGAEVAYTDSLHYTKAFVDLTLSRDKWYMLSTPLQNMYAGDYWLAPLGVTAANGAAYNRNNPRVYMQQYQLQNPETGYFPGAANWSKSFNTLDVTLGLGQGFVAGIDQPGTDQTFHFPRPETKMEYFSKATGLPAGQWTPTLDRSNSYRMHIEPGFSEIMPVSWDSVSRSTIIIGNPFMSHLSFAALRAGNPGLFGSTYYVWTGTSFDAFNIAGNQSTKTNWTSQAIDQIPPMQSFIVEKQDSSSLITSLNLYSGMTSTAPGINLRSEGEGLQGSLNLAVFRNDTRQSAATLVAAGGKNVSTLFSSTVKDPAVVYFGTQDAPYSICSSSLEHELEVGIRTTQKGMLSIQIQKGEDFPSSSRVYLEDRLLNYKQDMGENPTYTFNNDSGDIQGRFFLKVFNNTTGINSPTADSQISIYTAANTVHVVSSEEPILRIEAFNTQGQAIYLRNNLNLANYSFELNGGSQLVLIKVTTATHTKTEKFYLK